MTPRRPRTALVLATAVTLLLTAGVLGVAARRGPRGAGNESIVPGLAVYPLEGRYAGYQTPGQVVLTSLVGFEVTAPVILLDVRPYRVTPGVEVIARAYFYGRGSISPSGHRMFTGAPGDDCSDGPWPPTGYGRSWPIAGLTLLPGDPVQIGFFVRPPAVVGDHAAYGYRIRYRTANGKIHTVTGDQGHVDMYVRNAADLVNQAGTCGPSPHNSWFEPMRGYPN